MLRRSVDDRSVDFMVVNEVREFDIIGYKKDLLELIAFSYHNIGKDIVSVLSIGYAEWRQVLY